jgi:serine/threonine protein phosphatase PrpC
MGNCFLDEPKTEKEIQDGDIAKYVYGAAEMQGWRNSMEDAIICDHNVLNDVGYFGVFDGHGGHEVAYFVKEFLVAELKKLDSFKEGKY